MNARYRRHCTLLGVLFLALWSALAIQPLDREAWLLENVPVFAAVIVFWCIRRKFVFSRLSYTLIFVFLCLHEIGAHYTYSKVPYNECFQAILGRSLNQFLGWERNNYDRALHFLYGFLFAYPIREIFLRVANVRGFWGYFLPLDLTMSTSMLYELVEWAVAAISAGPSAWPISECRATCGMRTRTWVWPASARCLPWALPRRSTRGSSGIFPANGSTASGSNTPLHLARKRSPG
jgi:putative membrane protein